MNLFCFDVLIRSLGGVLAYAALAILLYGIWRGMQRQAGRVTGRTGGWLRSPWFYIVTITSFFAFCYFGWIPLPLAISPQARVWMLVLGSLLYFPGMAFMLWGRLALGKNYYVSTGFGTQLFADHHLVTSGPFAIVRHPMYTGLALAAFGALLIYSTWTTLIFSIYTPLTGVRTWQEERALEAEFGDEWRNYCRRVPAFFPRLRKERFHA